jgi:nitrite reductase/ring-hydroxylating ferredoxin subunit
MKRLLLCLLALAATACEKPYVSSIPYARVNLELDLNFEDKDLLPPLAFKLYTPQNINQAGELTGFGGVLVYHGINALGTDAYYAFDAACPHEASRSVTVEVTDDHLYALCPRCHTRYDLLSGIGNPVEGPGKEQLKSYNVRFLADRNIIHITN